MLDPNFFDRVFNGNDEDEFEETTYTTRELKFKYSFKMEMWKKTVLDYIYFKDKFVKAFLSMDEELNKAELEETGTLISFSKAWNYIQDIDFDDEEWIKAIYLSSGDEFEYSLELGIKYFESLEEYEKCAILLKILKESEKFSI